MAKITGVKAHTIRMWEKRYGLFDPKRCLLNIRSYEEKDLDLLKCITTLRRNGKKIGDIAEMTKAEMDHEAICCCQGRKNCTDHQDIISKVIKQLDADGIERWIDQKMTELGLEPAMTLEIFPLQNKLHLLKMTGKVSKINCGLFDQIVARKLSVCIQQEKLKIRHTAKKALLFIPFAPDQGTCNLFLHYILLAREYKTLNIGSTYDLDEIGTLIKSTGHFDVIVTILTEKFNVSSAKEYIEQLASLAPNSRIYVSGYQSKTLISQVSEHITVFENMGDMTEIY